MRTAALAAIFLIAVPASLRGQAPGTVDDDVVPLSFMLKATPHTAHAGPSPTVGVCWEIARTEPAWHRFTSNWSSYFYQPESMEAASPNSPGSTPWSATLHSPRGRTAMERGDYLDRRTYRPGKRRLAQL